MTDKTETLFRQIVCGVIIILISGWIGYVSLKGSSLEAVDSGLSTRVAVLESVTKTIKDDVVEIKTLIREVRDDQKLRNIKDRK